MKDRRKNKGTVEVGGRRSTDLSSHDRILNLEDNQNQLMDDIKEIKDLLRPISDTYTTVSKLGKWGMGLLVFASVIIGIIIGLKSIVGHK